MRFQRASRAATAVLLLLTMSPGMPVVCFAATHTELELPFAPCCSHHAAPVRSSGILLEAPPPGCGDCDDVPLASTHQAIHMQVCVLAAAAAAPMTLFLSVHQIERAVSLLRPLPLRC